MMAFCKSNILICLDTSLRSTLKRSPSDIDRRSVSKQAPLKQKRFTIDLSFIFFMLSSYAFITSLKLVVLISRCMLLSFAKCLRPALMSFAYTSSKFSSQSCFYCSIIFKHCSKYPTDSFLFSSLSSKSITAVVPRISCKNSLYFGYSIFY